MDFIKLGLRNIIGITLPGVLFVLGLFYLCWNIGQFWNISVFTQSVENLDQEKIPLVLAVFVISYVLGSFFRLDSADQLDKNSSLCKLKEWRSEWCKTAEQKVFYEIQENDFDVIKEKWNAKQNATFPTIYEDWKKLPKKEQVVLIEEIFNNIKAKLLKTGFDDTTPMIPTAFDEWIWREEIFPYPVWSLIKAKDYLPKGLFDLYNQQQKYMGLGNKKCSRMKMFFNYCKMEILHAAGSSGNGLAAEIYSHEANTRFFSGTYKSVLYSRNLFGLLFIAHIIFWKYTPSSFELKMALLATNFFLIISMWRIMYNIMQRFRGLRHKEVDTVLDAYYLIHKEE